MLENNVLKKKNSNYHVIPLEYDQHNSNQSHLLIIIPFVCSTANQISLLTVTQTGLLLKFCICFSFAECFYLRYPYVSLTQISIQMPASQGACPSLILYCVPQNPVLSYSPTLFFTLEIINEFNNTYLICIFLHFI